MEEREPLSQALKHRLVPLSVYWFKDIVRQIVENRNFHDSLATAFTFASLGIVFPFFPIEVFVPLLAVVFVATFLSPLLGLIALLFFTLPLLIYQAPLLAWFFMMIMGASLILGYKHYRTITYGYALAVLPLSMLGAYLEIPGLIISILVLGFKRSAIIGSAAIILVVIVSNLSNIQVSGPMVYNSQTGHAAILQNGNFTTYFTSTKSAVAFGSLGSAWSQAFSNLFSSKVTNHIPDTFSYAGSALGYQLQFTLLQIIIWVFIAFSVSSYAVKSRSPYKGTMASLFGAILPFSAFMLSPLAGLQFSYLTIGSFLATPVFIFILEASGVDVVLALDVMKQDILGQFGVAFEDLSKGSNETLNNVANYEETKKELSQAMLAPIEHREITGAYKVTAPRGILLFGPPGTGKTLLMRALANEIRAGFFYIKGASILSPYSGESAQTIARIFATAKKQAPCVLFIDEIDGIAGRREEQASQIGRELVTALLSEMDGFQKVQGVVIVGATNTPQLLDPAVMRPGRFDKILYMPLPDQHGRAAIFKYYLSSLPITKEVDYDKLATLTPRYSPADIKNVCEEVSRQVGEVAITKHQVLAIKMSDIVKVLKSTKPSTSLAQVDAYNTFKIDYERRAHPEVQVEKTKKITFDEVIDLEEARKALKEAVEIPILHPELIKKYDIGNVKGILLFGPPGTGKTMLMEAMKNEYSDINMITISGYEISKYGPERALESIKEMFDRARENAPAVVFIDEIDALMQSRDKANDIGVQIAGEFLVEFDKIKEANDVVVVAATNRPDVLDPALLRAGRFDKLIFTPPPNAGDRAKLFERCLEKAPVAKDVDFEKLAEQTEGFTGADISNVCRQAKLNCLEASLASGNEEEINSEELNKLLQKSRPSAPNIVLGRYLNFFGTYGKR